MVNCEPTSVADPRRAEKEPDTVAKDEPEAKEAKAQAPDA